MNGNASSYKKVLFIVSSLQRGGPINHLYELTQILRYKNYNISLLSLSNEYVEKSRVKDFLHMNITVHSFDYNGYNLFLLSKKIKAFIFANKIDLVVTQGFRSDCTLGLFLSKYKSVSILHNYIGPDYHLQYGRWLGKAMTALHCYSLQRIDNVISVSQSVGDYIKKNYEIESISIRNGVAISHDMRLEKSANAPIKLIYVGNLDERKNVDKLFSFVLNREGVELSVLGDGPKRDFFENKYGGNNIKFLGYLDSIIEKICEHDIFVSASTFEGLPMAALEALSVGLPCILSDIDPHREIINLDSSFGVINEFTDWEKFQKDIMICSSISPMVIKERFRLLLSSDVMAEKYDCELKRLSFNI